MTIGIYCIENMIDGKRYIGKSIQIEKRIKKHWWVLSKEDPESWDVRPNRHLVRAVKKHGLENFTHSIVEEFDCADEKVLADREVYWMDFYKTLDRNHGYNLMRDSSSIVIVSQETKELIATRSRGRIRSEEARINGSKAKMGEKNPMYGVRGELHPSYGKKHSEESRKRNSEGHLKLSYEQRRKDGTLVKVWDSIHEIEASGLFMANKVRDVASGQKNRLSHKGFLWVAIPRNS